MNEPDANAEAPLLDKDQLQMLIDASADESLDLFVEILELFEQESVVKLAELRSLRDAGSYDLMGRAAHALAGSSANVGGLEVWKIAKKIENLCKNSHGEEASACIDDLELSYSRTLAALREFGRTGNLEVS